MTPTDGATVVSQDDLMPEELDEVERLDEYELEGLLGCYVELDRGD